MAQRFDSRDFKFVAEWVYEEYTRRKRLRGELDRQWDDIERQVDMIPDLSFKLDAKGNRIAERAWMPEVEPELQAETLEILTADARRLMFPMSGPWYSAHGVLTDDYLREVSLKGLIVGDQNDIPSLITQDAVNQMCAATVSMWHRQYDFFKHIDLINSDVFKFGVGVGRAKLVRKSVAAEMSKGILKVEQKIPMLLPRSIRKTYLDDREFNLLHQGFSFGGSVIYAETYNVIDIKMAARKGGSDPDDEEGGWMSGNIKGLEGDKHGDITVLEWEGDLVVPRKTTDDLILDGRPIITVAIGTKGSDGLMPRIIRFRWNKLKGSTHIPFTYNPDNLKTPYTSSPLRKGRPLQAGVAEAFRRFLMAAALDTDPPLKWDRSDMYLAATGGPKVYPGAQWGSIDANVDAVKIGDPQTMLAAYVQFRLQHAGVSGMTAARSGSQTVSHTTAYAKQAELVRGEIRTTDYVNATFRSSFPQWLGIAYELGRPQLRNTVVYIDAYNGNVRLNPEDLPKDVTWDVHGAGEPAEQQTKLTQRMDAVRTAVGLEQLKAQMQELQAKGIPFKPTLDLDKMIEQVLLQGGWTDIDAITDTARTLPAQGTPGGPPMAQPAPGTSFAPAAALSAIGQQIDQAA